MRFVWISVTREREWEVPGERRTAVSREKHRLIQLTWSDQRPVPLEIYGYFRYWLTQLTDLPITSRPMSGYGHSRSISAGTVIPTGQHRSR